MAAKVDEETSRPEHVTLSTRLCSSDTNLHPSIPHPTIIKRDQIPIIISEVAVIAMLHRANCPNLPRMYDMYPECRSLAHASPTNTRVTPTAHMIVEMERLVCTFAEIKRNRDIQIAMSSTSALLRVFADVAETLAFAHARGICHNDVKPCNLMFRQARGAQWSGVVIDWGNATPDPKNFSPRETTTYSVRAPDSKCGPAADVWSFATSLVCVLFNTFAQRRSSPAELNKVRRHVMEFNSLINQRHVTGIQNWLCLDGGPGMLWPDPPELFTQPALAWVQACFHRQRRNRPTMQELLDGPLAPWRTSAAHAQLRLRSLPCQLDTYAAAVRRQAPSPSPSSSPPLRLPPSHLGRPSSVFHRDIDQVRATTPATIANSSHIPPPPKRLISRRLQVFRRQITRLATSPEQKKMVRVVLAPLIFRALFPRNNLPITHCQITRGMCAALCRLFMNAEGCTQST